jgi:hypothetical protein
MIQMTHCINQLLVKLFMGLALIICIKIIGKTRNRQARLNNTVIVRHRLNVVVN